VLQTLCVGDTVQVRNAAVLVSLYGRGDFWIRPGQPYTVQPVQGRASYAGNAYRSFDEKTMPDMQRMRAEVRLKGGAEPFEFAVESLAAGGQEVSIGRSNLLVRVSGGQGPYVGRMTDSAGHAWTASSTTADLLFSGVALAPGLVKVSVSDASGHHLEGGFEGSPTLATYPADYRDLDDAEVRAAGEAIDLARSAPKTRSLEAEQQLNSAPAGGLDRETVYELIESY
jgi:hypothetical protein